MHDYATVGEIEAEIHRKREELELARLDGDSLEAHNIERTIHQLEQELDSVTREPMRIHS